MSFSAADDLKAMRIRLSEDEELWLKGRIDRLDLCRDEELVYVKIIDYKSGSTSFDLAALYYGLQLQLVVYMDAALERRSGRIRGLSRSPQGFFITISRIPLSRDKRRWIPGRLRSRSESSFG